MFVVDIVAEAGNLRIGGPHTPGTSPCDTDAVPRAVNHLVAGSVLRREGLRQRYSSQRRPLPGPG